MPERSTIVDTATPAVKDSSATEVRKTASTPRERVHRLTDIDVDEVSLVDHAANKRKFLVVKRSTPMGIELESDGKGGFKKASAKVAAACGPDGKKKPMAKMDLPPGAREVLTPVLTRVCDKITAVLEAVGDADVAEVGEDGAVPPMPEEVWAGLGEAVALLGQLETQYPRAAAPPAEEAEGEEVAPNSEMDEDEVEMRFDAATKALVAKVGRRMSKDRLARFEQALSVLGSILGELQAPNEAPTQMSAPASPAAQDEAKRAPAAKADEQPELAAQLSALAAQVQKMASIVTQQRTELAQLRKARGASSALPVDDGRTESEESFSWPLDLNRPVSREGTPRTQSFFDND